MERRNAWLSYGENEEKEMEQIAKLRAFWMQGKTERECVTRADLERGRGCRLCFWAGAEACIRRKYLSGREISGLLSVAMNKILVFFHRTGAAGKE